MGFSRRVAFERRGSSIREEKDMWREAVWEKMDWIFHIHGERAREKKRVWKTTTFFFFS